MSNPLKDQIIEIIHQEISALQDTFNGIVMTYNREYGTAKVAYMRESLGYTIIDNVAVPTSIISVFGDDPKAGDSVVIKFVNSMDTASIVSISRDGRKDLSTGKNFIRPSTLDSLGGM